MRVSFFKHDDAKRICAWEAVRGRRTRVPGTLMGYGAGLPHDLAQYVVEAATGYERGFWGLVAEGATFRSMRRRRTRPGREVITAHHEELQHSEVVAKGHLMSWKAGEKNSVTAALDDALAKWKSLEPGDRLVFKWPAPIGCVEPRLMAS